jgi:hypothetical protein
LEPVNTDRSSSLLLQVVSKARAVSPKDLFGGERAPINVVTSRQPLANGRAPKVVVLARSSRSPEKKPKNSVGAERGDLRANSEPDHV